MTISPVPVLKGKTCKIIFNLPSDELKDCYLVIFSTSGEKVYENHRLKPVMEIRGLQQGHYIVRLSDVNNRNRQMGRIMVVD